MEKSLNEDEKGKARYRLDEEQEANFKRRFIKEMRREETWLEKRKKYGNEDEKALVRESLQMIFTKLVITKLKVQPWIGPISGNSSIQRLTSRTWVLSQNVNICRRF